jgi:hypothetical protein
MQELLVGSQEFERNKFLQGESQKYQSAENLESRKVTSAEAALDRSFRTALTNKANEFNLAIATAQSKGEEARINGDIATAEQYEASVAEYRKEAAKNSGKLVAYNVAKDKSGTEQKQLFGEVAGQLSKTRDAYKMSVDNATSAMPGIVADRDVRAVEKRRQVIRDYRNTPTTNAQAAAKLVESFVSPGTALGGALGYDTSLTPQLSELDAERFPGIEFLELDTEAVAGNVRGVFNPGRTKDSYLVKGELPEEKIVQMVNSDLKETFLTAAKNIGLKIVDDAGMDHALDLMMSGTSTNAEVVDAITKAGVDPVVIKGIILEMKKSVTTSASGQKLQRAQAYRDASHKEAKDQISLGTQAADAYLKSVQKEALSLSRMDRALGDVSGLQDYETMLEVIERWRSGGYISPENKSKVEGLLGTKDQPLSLVGKLATSIDATRANDEDALKLTARNLELEGLKQEQASKFKVGGLRSNLREKQTERAALEGLMPH